MPHETSDEELMAQYQNGSEEAFRILYARHSGKILGYLKSRLRSQVEVADLFQEVFVKIHRSKNLYKKEWPLLPWIFSVTHSVMIDGLRRKARGKEVSEPDLDQWPSASFVNQTDATAEVAEVLPLIQRLPENQKQALQLRYLEEKTFEEIATTLKTSSLNVRQLISRGLRQLKSLITERSEP